MKKNYFQNVMEKLSSEKEENIQILIKLSFDRLHELRNYYFRLHIDAKDMGYDEAEQVHYVKYLLIDEALEVKMGNEALA